MINKVREESGRTLRGLAMAIEAVSLLVVSLFSVWAIRVRMQMRPEYEAVVLLAALVIGLRGAWEFVRHMRRLGE